MKTTAAASMGAGRGKAVTVTLPPAAAAVLAIYVQDGETAEFAGRDAYQHKSKLRVHVSNARRVNGGRIVAVRRARDFVPAGRKDCPTASSTF